MPLDQFAELRVKTGEFGNKSEYIRHLIRQDKEQITQNQIDYLNRVLQESEESGLSERSPREIKAELERLSNSVYH